MVIVRVGLLLYVKRKHDFLNIEFFDIKIIVFEIFADQNTDIVYPFYDLAPMIHMLKSDKVEASASALSKKILKRFCCFDLYIDCVSV